MRAIKNYSGNLKKSVGASLKVLLLLGVGCLLASGVTAPYARIHLQEQSAPPPVRKLSEEDRLKLVPVRDLKERTKLSVEMATARLTSAEQYTTASRFDEASAELGLYQALIEDALGFLAGIKDKNNKLRDNYKRLELALRAHVPRIETIRRSTPNEYAPNMRNVADFTRNARSEALNSFYGDTVLRGSQSEHKQGRSTNTNSPSMDPTNKRP
jgi:hypothetical protein